MTKPGAKKTNLEDADLRPDAWDRFERAVDLAAKRSPLHKSAKHQKAASRAKTANRKPKTKR